MYVIIINNLEFSLHYCAYMDFGLQNSNKELVTSQIGYQSANSHRFIKTSKLTSNLNVSNNDMDDSLNPSKILMNESSKLYSPVNEFIHWWYKLKL